jgi:hypothetical protein
MRTLLVLAILALAAPASADAPALQVTADQVLDLGGTAGKSDVEAALTAASVTKAALRCTGSGDLLAWVVFQNGKVAQAEVGGSSDRAFEKCIATALRTATLGAKTRVVATLKVSVPMRSGATLDKVLEANPGMTIAKLDDPNAPAAPDDPGKLTRSDIDGTIKASARAVRGCYQKELASSPKLAGKVVVKFRIGGDGAVVSASIASSTLASAPAVACILATIKQLKFPAKGAPASVSYPFIFSAG